MDDPSIMPASQDDIGAAQLSSSLAALFTDAGLSAERAAILADILVDSDLRGVPSHGCMHAPIYLKRLYDGTLSCLDHPETVIDLGAIAVQDGHAMMGHLAALDAMEMAITKARAHGIGLVALRNAGHFGAAASYVRQAAGRDCIGIVMGNATALIAAPGGAERLTGTNPLAIGLPGGGADPVVLDMAMSEAAFGRIRMAKRKGVPIPSGWALGPDGQPTTDPDQALIGLLQPIGGHKGFGLSVMIDLLCGLLSEGPHGPDMPGLYDALDRPLTYSLICLAIDIAAFRAIDGFKMDVAAYAERVRHSRTVPGAPSIAMPGDGSAARRAKSKGRVRLEPALKAQLTDLARQRGLDLAF